MTEPRRTFQPDRSRRHADALRDRMRSRAPASGPVPSPDQRPLATPQQAPVPPQVQLPQPPSVQPPVQQRQPQQQQQQPVYQPQPAPQVLPEANYAQPEVDTPSALDNFAVKLDFDKLKPRVKKPSWLRMPHLSAPSFTKNKSFVVTSILTGVILVVAVGFGGYHSYVKTHYNTAFPATVSHKAKYTVYYPPKSSNVKVDAKSIKYDPQGELTSYVGYTTNKNKLIISEQPAPDTLVGNQPAYEKLIKSLKGYSSVKTKYGVVYLTHPAQFDGGQFAVLRTKDTLLFIRPAKDVSDKQWGEIYSGFKPVQQGQEPSL